MSKSDHPFIMIPGAILDRDDLSLAEKVIFGCIHSATMGTAHKCFLTNEELSRRTRIHVNHVRRVLASLETARLIKRRYSKSHHRSKIDVTWKGGSVVVVETSDDGARKMLQGGAQEMAGGAQDVAPPATNCCTPTTLHSTIDNNPPRPPEPGGGVDDLLDLAKTIGLRGATRAKLSDTVSVFGRAQVELALAEAKRHKAGAWGYCLSCLERWRSGESAPTVPKREPKRPCDLPYQGRPAPDADALPPDEIAANIRAMLAGVAKSKP